MTAKVLKQIDSFQNFRLKYVSTTKVFKKDFDIGNYILY